MGKGVGHRDHVEAMEAGGHEFDPRPEHYSRQLVRFSHLNVPFFQNSEFIVPMGKQ